MVHIELVIKGSELVFHPPLSDLEDIVDRLITVIVESAHKLPRVEHVLFPDLEGFSLLIPAIQYDDETVTATRNHAQKIVAANFKGTGKYVS